MQLFNYLSLAFVGSAVASSLVARADFNTVVADVAIVRERLVTLNNSVTAFNGNFFQALPVQINSGKLETALEQTINDTNASPPFGDNSAPVAFALLNLSPDIFSTLDNLISKKPAFDRGRFLTPIVRSSLRKQRTLSRQLGDAVIPKLNEDFAAIAPVLVQEIDDKFAEAINVYSTGGFF